MVNLWSPELDFLGKGCGVVSADEDREVEIVFDEMRQLFDTLIISCELGGYAD